jgi:L-ascorbate metabolism protein UlaG (beta-lactamase superfamily)
MSCNNKNCSRFGISGYVFSTLTVLFIGGMTMATSCSTIHYQGARRTAIEKSPQWRDGQFHNTLERQDSSIIDLIRKGFHAPDHQVPEINVPIVKRRAEEFSTPPSSGLRVTWLGHSTVLVEIDGHRILTDPVFSKRVTPVSGIGPKRFFAPPIPLEALPVLDAVVISHDHYDHLDKKSIKALKDTVPLFVVPLGVGAHLEKWDVPAERIVELDWWEKTQVGALTLTATPARHFSGRSLTNIYANDTLWAGWAIAGPTHRVYYSGDSAMFPGFETIGKRLGPFDITLIESGAYDALWPDVHLGPEQAIEAHRMVRGKLMIPVHWGTFNLANHSWTEPAERILTAGRRAGISTAIPKPGQSVDPAALPDLVRWWPKLPWQSAEAQPVISTGLKPVLQNNGS